VRIGLAGAGRMGAFHGEVLASTDGVDEVCVTDVDDDRAAALAASIGGSTAQSVAAMLEQGIDALVIASPTPTHAELIHTGVDAGVPVFCEKPVALDRETTEGVVEHVERSGVLVQIGFNRRFDAGFQAARRSLEDGSVGTLFVVRMGTHDPAPPPVEYLAGSGGLFRDMHIHDFDALRFVTGDEVEQVYADGAVKVDPAIGELGDVDTTALVLRMRSGALAIMSGCRRNPRGYDVRVELFGSNDSVTVGIEERVPLRSLDNGGLLQGERGWEFFIDRFHAAYRAQMADFVDRVARGTNESACSVHDAHEALLLAIAAERSVRDGVPVKLDEVRREAVHA
jgi:myo-inositol 2-dehydrogenase / D-chiro-inositol 1-dehydrogenase